MPADSEPHTPFTSGADTHLCSHADVRPMSVSKRDPKLQWNQVWCLFTFEQAMKNN
jgi:hypothetical protein